MVPTLSTAADPAAQRIVPRTSSAAALPESQQHQYDAIIVGSGPGGAAVGRELARAGRRVLIVERGRDWLRTEYGIDLRDHADAIARELGVAPLPPALRGAASTRIAEAGTELGMPWHPQDKFLAPARAARFDCGAHCLLGCRCGAKWNAGEWIDDAVAAGATLLTSVHVTGLVIEDGAVHGVRGTHAGRSFTAHARVVVVAAGGIGTPVLLRAAGIDAAGQGIAMDTTVMVYGALRGAEGASQGADPPMTWSCPDDELGVMYSTLIDPWLMYPIIMAIKGARWPLTWPRWKRTLGVMIKLTDELSGSVDTRGSVDKGLTERDRTRLRRAEDVARRILLRAGCDEHTLVTTPLRGTHPSATARIGTVVTEQLATAITGLYVCDASVFPRALGRPTVLTILALGRRLGRALFNSARS